MCRRTQNKTEVRTSKVRKPSCSTHYTHIHGIITKGNGRMTYSATTASHVKVRVSHDTLSVPAKRTNCTHAHKNTHANKQISQRVQKLTFNHWTSRSFNVRNEFTPKWHRTLLRTHITSIWRCMHHASYCNVYISTPTTCIDSYNVSLFVIKCSTCFGLFSPSSGATFWSCISQLV